MRQIDLSEYQIKVSPYGGIGEEGAPATNGSQEELTYDVKHSLIEVLFANPVTPEELLKIDQIATKIRDCPNDKLLLTEWEYQKLVQIMKQLKIFGPRDVQFVQRVLGAPDVTVQPKEPEAQPK